MSGSFFILRLLDVLESFRELMEEVVGEDLFCDRKDSKFGGGRYSRKGMEWDILLATPYIFKLVFSKVAVYQVA